MPNLKTGSGQEQPVTARESGRSSFDLEGGRKWVKPACGGPLDGGVKPWRAPWPSFHCCGDFQDQLRRIRPPLLPP